MADLGPFDLLDVAATCDHDAREVVLGVVSRDRERAMETTVQLADGAGASPAVTAYEVNGADPAATNTFAQPRAVGVVERRISPEGVSFAYTFPAHSITVLRMRVARA